MATQPTTNAVPSESRRDLKFNAGKINEFVTSLALKYQDRFGADHYTIEGLRWLAQQAIAEFGWISVGTFQAGATLTLPNQILKDTTDGEYYRWNGELPKSVAARSTPLGSDGIGVNSWIAVGDSALRSLIASSDGASAIGTESGENSQYELNSLHKSVDTIPSRFSIAYSEDIIGTDYAQGLSESDKFWFIGYDNNHLGHVKRILKSDFISIDIGTITSSHLQGIAVIDDDTIMVGGNNDGGEHQVQFCKRKINNTIYSWI